MPGGPLLHVFQPGADSSGGMGVRIEPCTFTDFKGFVAVAFLRGSATDQDGHPLEADLDIRVFQGEYVGTDGHRGDGTFAYVSLDLFEIRKGSRVQLHAIHPASTGGSPFWTVRIPDDALELGSTTARLRVNDLEVADDFRFLGSSQRPARIDFDITLVARGHSVRHRPDSHDPIAATNFDAELFPASARGSFAARERGFRCGGTGTAERGFAELGRERNGSFLFEREEFITAVDVFDEEGFPAEIDLAHATMGTKMARAALPARSAPRCALRVDPFHLDERIAAEAPTDRSEEKGRLPMGTLRTASYVRLAPGIYLMRPHAGTARIVLMH